MNIQYGVIGRLRRNHDAYGLRPEEIGGIIATELLSYVDTDDVMYVPPNFIIRLHTPHAQQEILADPILETNHFQLEMVPWCKEHEWAQLPWLSGTEASKIWINPLQILPLLPRNYCCQGSSRLMDAFAEKIPKHYDLQAPDFSYLLITELKNFYKKKFSVFIKSKKIATAMSSIIIDIVPKTEKLFSTMALSIQRSQIAVNTAGAPDIRHFIEGLKTAITHTNIPLSQICELADPVLKYDHTALDLDSFKEGPPAIEIPAPPTYADRLKTIYITAVKKIYPTSPIIETIKKEENRYETYVTVDGFTRRYFGSHTRSASSMEAAAIYYALKHLTNVQGYQIFDLNYPILRHLVHDVNTWNSEINILQIFGTAAVQAVQNIKQNVHNQCTQEKLIKLGIHTLQSLTEATQPLLTAVDQIHDSIGTLYDDLHASKVTYAAHRIGIYSPTRSVLQWGRANRPNI